MSLFVKWTQRKALCDVFPPVVQLQLGSQSESQPGSQLGPPSRSQLGYQPGSRLQSQSCCSQVSESVNSGLIFYSDIQSHARWNSLKMLYRYKCQTLESQLKASRLLLISRV